MSFAISSKDATIHIDFFNSSHNQLESMDFLITDDPNLFLDFVKFIPFDAINNLLLVSKRIFEVLAKFKKDLIKFYNSFKVVGIKKEPICEQIFLEDKRSRLALITISEFDSSYQSFERIEKRFDGSYYNIKISHTHRTISIRESNNRGRYSRSVSFDQNWMISEECKKFESDDETKYIYKAEKGIVEIVNNAIGEIYRDQGKTLLFMYKLNKMAIKHNVKYLFMEDICHETVEWVIIGKITFLNIELNRQKYRLCYVRERLVSIWKIGGLWEKKQKMRKYKSIVAEYGILKREMLM